jgi:hypothetical protein
MMTKYGLKKSSFPECYFAKIEVKKHNHHGIRPLF